MLKQLVATGLACLALTACGPGPNPHTGNPNNADNSNNAGNGNATSGAVTFNVDVRTFAFDKTATTLDQNFLQVTLKDPAQLLAGAAQNGNTINIDKSKCAPDAASGTIQCQVAVDVSALTQGLVIATSDNRQSSDPPRWQTTYTMLGQDVIKTLQPASKVATLAHAVTTAEVTAIATLTGAANSAALLTNGAVLTEVQDSTGKALAGAAVVPGDGYVVTYADDTGAAKGANPVTGALGLSLEVSSVKATGLASGWTIKAPPGDAETWTVPATIAAPFVLTVQTARATK